MAIIIYICCFVARQMQLLSNTAWGGGHTLPSWGPMRPKLFSFHAYGYSRKINVAGLFIQRFGDQPKIQFGVTKHNNHRDYLSDRPRLVGATSLDCSCCHDRGSLSLFLYECLRECKQDDCWSRVVVLKLCRAFQTTVRSICEIKLHPHTIILFLFVF